MKSRLFSVLGVLLALIPALIVVRPQPVQAANSIQSILSPTGLTAYDSATSGSYFAVSEADFTAATTNLSSVTKLGMADSERTNACVQFAGNYMTVLDNTIIIPANAYILGYAVRLAGNPGNTGARLLVSSSYKGSYNFLVSSNFPGASSGMNYFLFKSPVTSSSVRYVGNWTSVNQCQGAFASTTGGYVLSTTEPKVITNNYSNNFPFLQLLYTTVDHWSVPSSIELSVNGNSTTAVKGNQIQLNASTSDDGLVTFKSNGKNIANCIAIKSSSRTATCNWKPTVKGSATLTAILRSPSGSFSQSTSQAFQVKVSNRINKR